MRHATGSDEAADQQLVLEQGTGMLETFLSLMPDAAVAVNRDGVIVAVNVRTESFFGYPSDELEGKPIEVLVPERFRHAHRRDRAEFSSDPHARPMGAGLDLYARRRDGTEFPVDISLAPIGDKDNTLVVAAVRDITERKAAQSAPGSAGRHRALLHRRHLLHDATWGNDQLEPGGGGNVRLFTYRRDRAPLQRVLPR